MLCNQRALILEYGKNRVSKWTNGPLDPPAIPRTRSVSNLEKNMQGRSPHDSPDAQDTVDSEVYVKTPRGHSAVTMDPWTSSTWRKPWNKYHTPNKVTKDKLNRFAQQKTHRGISLNRTARRQGHTGRSGWSPRPTKKYNPRALGLISGPCLSHFPRQVQLKQNKKRRRWRMQSNPRKRAREATPFTTHEAPLEISSDEEEDQDKTSPTSPPWPWKRTSHSPWIPAKVPGIPSPRLTVQMTKTLAACLTL